MLLAEASKIIFRMKENVDEVSEYAGQQCAG